MINQLSDDEVKRQAEQLQSLQESLSRTGLGHPDKQRLSALCAQHLGKIKNIF